MAELLAARGHDATTVVEQDWQAGNARQCFVIVRSKRALEELKLDELAGAVVVVSSRSARIRRPSRK